MKLLEKFFELVNVVRQDHKEQNASIGGGHDFAHALMVAQYCLQISEDPIATMAWVAGICHNTDRLFPELNDNELESKIYSYLSCINLNNQPICEAVMEHSKKPSLEDNPVTVVLKDADKLANIGALLVIRSAQFQPSLPQIDLRYLHQRPPNTSYKNPKSIYWDIKGALEWQEEGWLKTPKAIELAKPLFEDLQKILDNVVNQFEATGLLPYPFPEDFE